jgi:hypothetical protein
MRCLLQSLKSRIAAFVGTGIRAVETAMAKPEILTIAPFFPILPEEQSEERHRASRDKIAALEKALADALAQAGYTVLNDVACRKPLDEALWTEVWDAFTNRFRPLKRMKFVAAGGAR